jgi:WD40 repeat protein
MSAQPPEAASPAQDTGRPRTDHHGDPLPPGAIARLGTARFRHASNVTSVAFAPNGKELVSASIDKSLALWDVPSGKLLWRRWGQSDADARAVFSPDGKLIASAGRDKTVRLWDRATGKEIRQLASDSDRIHDLAFSADGEALFSVSGDDTIRKWQTSTGVEVSRWHAQEGAIQKAVFSSDGKYLALFHSDRTIRLWDVATGDQLYRLTEGQPWLSPPAFSADGRRLAAVAADKAIHLWRVDSGKEEARLPPSKEESAYSWSSLCFSPDGKYLAAGDNVYCNSSIRLWEVESRKVVRVFRGHCMAVLALRFAPDGTVLASGSADHTIRLWDVATGKELLPETGHGGALRGLALSPDGKLLASTGFDKTIRIWDAASGKELRKLTGHESLIRTLAFTPDGRELVSGSLDQTIRFWGPTTGQEFRPPLAAASPVHTLSIAPDGKTLVWAKDGVVGMDLIHYWDMASGKELRSTTLTSSPQSQPLSELAYTPRGQILSVVITATTAEGMLVSLREVETGKPLGQFAGQRRQGYFLNARLAVSPNGRLAAVSGGGVRTLRLVELLTGKEWAEFGNHPEEVNALTFAPDGRALATSCWDGIIRLWDVFSGNQLAALAGEQGHVYGLAFSRDGKTLISGGDDTTILLWDISAQTGREQANRQPLTPKELDGLWEDLGSADARKAGQALHTLASAPDQTARLLKERLRPVEPVDAKVVARHIAALDDEDFAVRQKATQELQKLADRVEPALRKALEGHPSPEAARRLQAILEKVPDPLSFAENLRWARALEVLEAVSPAQARAILEGLAAGADCWPTREAKASLLRLEKRRGPP